MAEEEDDYMSSAFIDRAASTARNTSSTIRKPKPPAKVKSFTTLQEETRAQGLTTALSEENKGFKLLKVMGYKEGQGLGKDASGSAEPLPLLVKRGRSGIGQEEKKRKQVEKASTKRVKLEANLLTTFKDRMKDKFSSKKVENQLKSAIAVCRNMDEVKGVISNPLLAEKDEDNGDTKEPKVLLLGNGSELLGNSSESVNEVDYTTMELGLILQYMRDEYLYCFFCGEKFDNKEDLDTNCPGLTEEDHE